MLADLQPLAEAWSEPSGLNPHDGATTVRVRFALFRPDGCSELAPRALRLVQRHAGAYEELLDIRTAV
jgi:hypothetical protein